MRKISVFAVIVLLGVAKAAIAVDTHYQWEVVSGSSCYLVDNQTGGKIVHEYISPPNSGCKKAMPPTHYEWQPTSYLGSLCYIVDIETHGKKYIMRAEPDESGCEQLVPKKTHYRMEKGSSGFDRFCFKVDDETDGKKFHELVWDNIDGLESIDALRCDAIDPNSTLNHFYTNLKRDTDVKATINRIKEGLEAIGGSGANDIVPVHQGN